MLINNKLKTIKMNSKIKLFAFVALATVLLSSCYPNEDIYYSDTDVAITAHDQDFTFEDNMICVLYDSVIHIVDEDEEVKHGTHDDYLISELTKNLKESKFTVYVAEDTTDLKNQGVALDDVDLVVHVSIMETDIYYAYYYNYWYWYGWGWYKSGSLKLTNKSDYYYYPGYGGTYYAYSKGTIFMDMIDAKSAVESGDDAVIAEHVVWNGIINGILSGNTTDTRKRITTQVTQCFTQSPYLN